jgi:hypothetical protein
MAVDGWAIVELMGHRERAGRVSEVEIAGARLLQIDIPTDNPEVFVTELYGGAAIFCLTPCAEQIARGQAKRLGDPRPIHPLDYMERQPRQLGFDDRDEEPE